MYCSKCGKKVSSSDKICKSCGATLFGHDIVAKSFLETWNIEEWFTGKGMIRFCKKLVLAVLVMLVYVFSKEVIVDLSGWYIERRMTISGLMKYVIESLHIMEQATSGTEICYFLFRISFFVYLIMLILAFTKKETAAMACGVIGFACNVPIICYIPKGIMVVAERLSFSLQKISIWVALNAIEGSFWVYVILNILLLVCSVRFFYNSREVKYRLKKDYSVDKIVHETPGEWYCKKCGEKNESYMKQCSVCGTKK